MVAPAAVAALSLAVAPGGSAATCSGDEVRAVMGSHIVCLREAAPCRLREQRFYARYGFRCNGRTLSYNWTMLRRPLHISLLSSGAACPASPGRGTLGDRGGTDGVTAPAFGPGPAFPTLAAVNGRAVVTMVWTPSDDPYRGWFGTKVLWTIPRAAGPVLVRGGQLDGTNRVGFDLGPAWTNRVRTELKLVGPESGLHPAATFVRTAGCYAYQIDTARSSYLIIFEARTD